MLSVSFKHAGKYLKGHYNGKSQYLLKSTPINHSGYKMLSKMNVNINHEYSRKKAAATKLFYSKDTFLHITWLDFHSKGSKDKVITAVVNELRKKKGIFIHSKLPRST